MRRKVLLKAWNNERIYPPKVLEEYLLRAETRIEGKGTCPNYECKHDREIETFLSLDLPRGKDLETEGKANLQLIYNCGWRVTTSKQVDSGNWTLDEDADVILMNELGLLGEEEQSSSKNTDKA